MSLRRIWERGRIDEKVDNYANGESDHAVEAMTLLWELLREDESRSTRLRFPQETPSLPGRAMTVTRRKHLSLSFPLGFFLPLSHFTHPKGHRNSGRIRGVSKSR